MAPAPIPEPPSNRMPTRILRFCGTAAVGLLWFAAAAVLAAAGAEIFLGAAATREVRLAEARLPRFTAIAKAYKPFAIQHIHPSFLFFYPYDKKLRAKIGNDRVSVSEHGFRGPGPAEAGGRHLAFLLGGSTAFGYLASSNDTTIPGWLNRLQARYFFVNAAVPSWITSQELGRLCLDLARWKPALVITLDGFNDIIVSLRRTDSGKLDRFPPGVPESFENLYGMIGDLKSRSPKPRKVPVLQRLLPHLYGRLRQSAQPGKNAEAKRRKYPPEITGRIADCYRGNIATMHALCLGSGIRFAAFFQPVRSLHRHLPPALPADSRALGFEAVHAAIFAAPPPSCLQDMSAMFDPLFQEIPCFMEESGCDIADTDIFLDSVHLSDLGNRLVAEEILKRLNAAPDKPAR